ncbi:MAG: hypothetical protein WC775_05690 [Patescibacteria group bacterium]|jgi:hypothetical protein
MSKTIVTHIRPDLDACAAPWLIRKYMPDWGNAELIFVPSGKTIDGGPADTDPNILHTDTGFGKFDHHHLRERSSAARRVFEYLEEKKLVRGAEREALERLVEVVTLFDNFEEVNFTNPNADYYDCMIHELLEGYKHLEKEDRTVFDFACAMLESYFKELFQKVQAEKELKKGEEFKVGTFKCLAIETHNEVSVHIAQKIGYAIVVRRDPIDGRVRIKARPGLTIELRPVYEALIAKDSVEKWFYHKSGKMVLNGSSHTPHIEPTKLTLDEVVAVVKEKL